jgi:serine/threonine protein phosphatase PrpC
MGIQAWAATDVGRKRKHNEDAFLADAGLGLFVVADGMGGHAAGEVASRRCIDAIRAQVVAEREILADVSREPTPQNIERAQGLIERAVQAACQDINALAGTDPKLHGMGTTCILLLICGSKGVIGHVGDSRVYLQRHGNTSQLTIDHSLIEEHIKYGRMTREQAEHSGIKNVITRAVGVLPSVQVDTVAVDLLPGDVFLLCSDGLHGYLMDGELGPILDQEDKQGLPKALVDLANDRGGKDNITAVVLSVPATANGAEPENIDRKIETFRRLPLLRFMTDLEILTVLSIAEARRFAPGEYLLREGDMNDQLFIVVKGSAVIRQVGVSIGKLSTGDHFGEISLFDPKQSRVTVVALEQMSVLALQCDALVKLLKKYPSLGEKMLWAFSASLAERLHGAHETVVQLRGKLDDWEAGRTNSIPPERKE